jgi:hypothetical protein
MKLWRIDADYVTGDGDVVGMLTWFSADGHGRYTTDAAPGWNIDRYEQDATGLTRAQIGRLLGRTWPTLPVEDLLAIADGFLTCGAAPLNESIELSEAAAAVEGVEQLAPHMADAKRQLASAIDRRQSWEKE